MFKKRKEKQGKQTFDFNTKYYQPKFKDEVFQEKIIRKNQMMKMLEFGINSYLKYILY